MTPVPKSGWLLKVQCAEPTLESAPGLPDEGLEPPLAAVSTAPSPRTRSRVSHDQSRPSRPNRRRIPRRQVPPSALGDHPVSLKHGGRRARRAQ
jgi:hypothetical protein